MDIEQRFNTPADIIEHVVESNDGIEFHRYDW